MTFLNSLFLAGLAAVAIPLLIHFLSRRRIKIIDFSSLKFLFQMQKSRLRWLKILELLLLIIRMLILALIVLAFARPALTGKQASSHAPASIVILLDNSSSVEMLSSGGTVFDDMKRGIEEILDMLNPNDEISLITLTGRQTASGPFSDFDRFRTLLYSLQPEASQPLFEDGLKKASEILEKSKNLNREIYIISDFQQGPWWNYTYEPINPEFRFFALKYFNENVENIGLIKTAFPPQLFAPGEEFEITALIRNFNNSAAANKLVELFIDDDRKARTSVDIKPNGTAATKFNIVAEKPGRHTGYFEIEDDDYSSDNRFYFNFLIPQKISILGVNENLAGRKILESCFGRSGTGFIEFTSIDISEFSRQNLSSFDVVVLNDISALPAPYFNSLADFVDSDGGLFVILGNNSNIESYKTFIENKAGIEFTKRIDASSAGQSESYFYLEKFDLNHPVFKIYSPRNIQPAEIPPLKLFAFTPLSRGITLARLEDNRSVLSSSANAKIMVMGFGLDRSSSDISIHSFIVPFLIRSVEHLASATSTTAEYYISGHPIAINLQGKTGASTVQLSRALNSPAGALNENREADKTVEISRTAHGAYVNLPYGCYPGFYSLSDREDTIGFFSVNHDSTESSTETIDSQRLVEIMGENVVFIDGQANVKTKIMQAKFGFELWKYCLILALVLLIAESVLIKKARS